MGRSVIGGSVSTYLPVTPPSSADAWVAQVVINGGTVSDPRKAFVAALIDGLVTDGIWTKLDRLWIFAAENTTSALTDIVALSSATRVNSATFSPNGGFTGNGTDMYIETNYNLGSAGPNLSLNDACLFAWQNTAGTGPNNIIGETFSRTQLNTEFTDTKCYWGIAGFSSAILVAAPGTRGLYAVVRTGASAQRLDLNGSNIDTSSESSAGGLANPLWSLRAGGYDNGREVSCFGLGSQLTAGESTNLYDRIRTYMTAVGVP